MRHAHAVAFALSVLLATTLAVPSALAQDKPPQAAPATVESARWFETPQKPGQRVEVLTIDGNWHKGRLRLVTGDAIVLEKEGTPIQRDRVWQVWAGGKPSWAWRGFWIGVAAGLGVGAGIRADQGDCADPTSICAREGNFGAGEVAALGVAFGAIGAIVGRLAKGPGREPALVYTAPPAVPAPQAPAR